MIIDHMDHIMNYEALLPNLRNGMEALKNSAGLETGRYEFEGGYFMVQKGVTKPIAEGTYEVHSKYIDVQIIIEAVSYTHLCPGKRKSV